MPATREEEPSGRPAKRRKTRLACQECRDKKTRCDGARPVCNACVRKQLAPDKCVYLDAQPDVESHYVKLLEARVRELERRHRPEGESGGAGEPIAAAAAAPPPRSLANDDDDDDDDPSTEIQASIVAVPAFPRPPPAPVPVGRDAPPPATPVPAGAGSLQSHAGGTQRSYHQRREGGGGGGGLRDPPPSTPGGDSDGGRGQVDDAAAAPAGDFMGASEGQLAEPGRMVFLGPSSAAAFMKEVQESSARERHSNYRGPGAITASSSSVARDRRKAKALGEFIDTLIVPPRRTADAHVAKYWNYSQPIHPILHKPTFMTRYAHLWDQDGDDHGHHGHNTVHEARAFHATLNLVFALGCTYHFAQGGPASSKTGAETFFDRSQQLLRDADLDHGSLGLVQAYLLAAHYLQSTDKINKCWLAVGTAVRLAQGIGIHLDLASDSQAERQERRRTWWGCVLMDRVLSMTFGRPPMVTWPTTVPLPEPIDDALLLQEPGSWSQPLARCATSEVAFFVQTLRLSNMLIAILQHLYRPPAEISSLVTSSLEGGDFKELNFILKIDGDLARWRHQLPDYLAYRGESEAETPDPVYARQASSLHCRYLHLRILLFRPITVDLAQGAFLHSEGPKQLTDFQHGVLTACVISCVRAAQELVSMFTEKSAGQAPPWWYSIFYLYTAGTVLLAVLTSPALQQAQTAGAGELQQAWMCCLQGLARYDRCGSGFAQRCLQILQKVYAERSGEEPRPFQPHQGGGPDKHGRMPNDEAAASQIQPVANAPGGQRPAVVNEGEGLGDLWWPVGGHDWLNGLPGDGESYDIGALADNFMCSRNMY